MITPILPSADFADGLSAPITEQATNPKEATGAAKPDLSLIPTPVLGLLAQVMQHGSDKYQPFSWRADKIASRTYVAAAMRHLCAYAEGEERDPDSGLPHLVHAAACLFILQDATDCNMVVDNRVPRPERPCVYYGLDQ